MTLILSIVNREQAILVSDRRLTAGARLVDNDSNKAAVLNLRDARLAVAYSGLARTGSFVTSRWLAEALMKAAPPDHLAEPTIERFWQQAGRDISSIPGTIDKRLTIFLAGHLHSYDPPWPYLWRVSNFEGGPGATPAGTAEDKFTRAYWRAAEPPGNCCLMVPGGVRGAIDSKHWGALHDLVHRCKPASAIVDKAIEVLQGAADSPGAGGTIGKRATSIIVPSDLSSSATMEYHSDQVSHRVGGITMIEARGDEFGIYVIESEYSEFYDASGQPSISVVPKVNSNRPCPCGSRKNYKNCHGVKGRRPGASFGASHIEGDG